MRTGLRGFRKGPMLSGIRCLTLSPRENTMTKAYLAASAMLAVAAVPTAASAAKFVNYTNRAAFSAAAGNVQTETFNSYKTDTVISSSVNFGPLKITDIRGPRTPGNTTIDAAPFQVGSFNGTSFVGTSVYDNARAGFKASLVFEFAKPITAFGGVWESGFVNTVQLGVLGSTVQQRVSGDRFFGFVSDTPFTRVEILAPAGTGITYRFDDITFSATGVPEPVTWATLIAGFGTVGGAMRRRSAKLRFA